MSTHVARGGGLRLALANTALVLIVLIVAGLLIFVVGEVFFRIKFGGAIDQTAAANPYEFDEQRGWRLRPGEYSRFNFASHRVVDISINEWGLRDRPLPADVPAGRERISVVGDSFVFSEALNASSRFTERLQELAGPAYEIVNVSVPGYGTGQQVRLIEELASRGFQIGSKVILVFFTNDIQDNLGLQSTTLETDLTKPVFRVDEGGNLVSVNPRKTKIQRRGKSFWERSLFFNYLKRRVEAAGTRFPAIFVALDMVGLAPEMPRSPGIVAGWYGPGWEERWSATQDILKYVATYLKTRQPGTEFQIAFVPSPLQVERVFKVMIDRNKDPDPRYAEFFADIDRPQRMLRAFTEARGIPFIDLTPALRQASDPYFLLEGRLNETGSEIAARVLYDRVLGGK